MPGPHRRLYISAARKSSGKTCLAIGLLRALRQRGLQVQPFKKGPDYIDPMWLSRAAGKPCYNLDFNTQNEEEILAAAGRSHQSDCSVVEGNKGLFDGMATDGSDSNAALAKLLQAPVALVLDCEGMTRGIAPLALGYQQFDADVAWAGVILNRTGGSRHEAKLVRALEEHTDLAVLGAIGRSGAMELAERHLGLVTCAERNDADALIERFARTVADSIDLDELAAPAAASPLPDPEPASAPPAPDLRIGCARDAAFNFHYADDLEWFAELGAELVPFDALQDAEPPAMDGLWLSGGFPETQARALSQNASMREALHAQLAAGLPAYAECGGLMYLSRRISWQGETWPMVGIIAGDCVVEERPQGRGLVQLEATEDFPWPGVEPGQTVPAHEFHYSRMENMEDGEKWGWKVRRGAGIAAEADGLVACNLFASYSHLRHTARFEWVRHFLDFVRECSGNRKTLRAEADRIRAMTKGTLEGSVRLLRDDRNR